MEQETLKIVEECLPYLKEKWMLIEKDHRGPLVNADKVAKLYNCSLPSETQLIYTDFKEDILKTQPGFANLKIEWLPMLRSALYSEKHIDLVTEWSEKLMLFCEIRIKSLWKTALGKWGNNKKAVSSGLLHLASFLLDCHFCFNDVRYLNVVLKILDIKKIFNPKNLKKNITSPSPDDFINGLFVFRLLLLSEYALDNIKKQSLSIQKQERNI